MASRTSTHSSTDGYGHGCGGYERCQFRRVPVWSKYSNAQRVSSLQLSKGLLESAIAVGYVFQFSGRSRDELEDHAELVVSKNTSELKICVPRRFG